MVESSGAMVEESETPCDQECVVQEAEDELILQLFVDLEEEYSEETTCQALLQLLRLYTYSNIVHHEIRCKVYTN